MLDVKDVMCKNLYIQVRSVLAAELMLMVSQDMRDEGEYSLFKPTGPRSALRVRAV